MAIPQPQMHLSTYVFLSTWLFLSNLQKELELFSPELSRQLLEVTMSLLSQQTPPPPPTGHCGFPSPANHPPSLVPVYQSGPTPSFLCPSPPVRALGLPPYIHGLYVDLRGIQLQTRLMSLCLGRSQHLP